MNRSEENRQYKSFRIACAAETIQDYLYGCSYQDCGFKDYEKGDLSSMLDRLIKTIVTGEIEED